MTDVEAEILSFPRAGTIDIIDSDHAGLGFQDDGYDETLSWVGD